MSRMRVTASILILAMSGVGCDKEPTAPPVPAKKSTHETPASDIRDLKEFLRKDEPITADKSALPPGHPPIGGSPAAKPVPADAALPSGHPPISAAPASPNPTLEYAVPSEWRQSPPTRAFRIAELTIPPAEGDTEEGQVIVFYFGPGQGGGVEDNLERWKGMFSTADGLPVGEDASRIERFGSNGLSITMIDVQGRYADAMSRPTQPGVTESDFRLLGAIVETPEGNWFFKGIGPAGTMQAHRDAFVTMMRDVRLPS